MTQNIYLHQFCSYKHPLNPTIIFQTAQNDTVWVKNDCFETRVSISTFSRKCLKIYEVPWQEITSKASLQHQHYTRAKGLAGHHGHLKCALFCQKLAKSCSGEEFSILPQCFLFNTFSPGMEYTTKDQRHLQQLSLR